jgi:Xaa-Pro dipeptidase
MEMGRAVIGAYDIAIRSVKIGMPCWKLHEKVDRFLQTKGYRMIHAMGHGLGKNIHELPYIGKPRKRLRGLKKRKWEKLKRIVFQEGMVFTIEPAVYVKNVGGFRLENDLLLTSKGPKILTHSKLIVV